MGPDLRQQDICDVCDLLFRPGIDERVFFGQGARERVAGATGLSRAAWAAGLSSSVNKMGASPACMCQPIGGVGKTAVIRYTRLR